VTLDRDVRVAMATPIVDPGFGELFVKFGGDLIDKDIAPDTDDLLGSEWQTLHTNDISQPEPRLWHFYFGRNNQVARADFATRFVHPL
jgi:hypothetical protein